MLTRALILTLMLGTLGCAPRATTPFHIYGSPLLRTSDYDATRQSSRAMAARASDTPIRDVYELPAKRTRVAARSSPRRTSRARTPRQPSPRPNTETPALSSRGKLAKKAATNPETAAGARADTAAQYVWDTLGINGVELPRHARLHVPKLYRACKKRGKIHFTSSALKPGAVVFFHNTYDANGDRRNNDWYTHVALVTKQDGHDITLIAYQDRGVQTFRMNLKAPGEGAQLRPRRDDDVPYTQYRAAELFAGVCHPKGMRPLKSPDMAWAP